MADHTPTTREERLAAKLRENLRRRKVQGREMSEKPGLPNTPGLPNNGDGR